MLTQVAHSYNNSWMTMCLQMLTDNRDLFVQN